MFTFLFIFLLQLVVSPLHGFFFRVEELRAPTHLSGSIKKVILCYDAHENQYPIDEGREDEFNRFAGESVEWMISLATEFRYRGDGVILLEGRDLSGDNLGPRTVPHSFPAHQTIKYNRCLITLISLTQIIHLFSVRCMDQTGQAVNPVFDRFKETVCQQRAAFDFGF